MKYTELSQYEIPAGYISEWIPEVTSEDAWKRDSRGLSYMHSDHLQRALNHPADAPRPGEWIGTVFKIQDTYDECVLSRTLQFWFGRHEAFRTRIVVNGDKFDRFCVASNDMRVVPRHLPGIYHKDAAKELITNIFDAAINPIRWPQIYVMTVCPALDDISTPDLESAGRDGFTLIFGADHSVMDAYTQVFAIEELVQIYRAFSSGEEPSLPPAASYVDYSHLERALGTALSSEDAAVVAWDDFLRDGMPGFPLPIQSQSDAAAGKPFNKKPRQGSDSLDTLDADQTNGFAQACKVLGGKMHAGVVAAMALAVKKIAGIDRMAFISPMHLRTSPELANSAGWYVGITPVDVDLSGISNFSEAIGVATKALDEYRHLLPYPFPRIGELRPHADVIPPRFVISFVDVRFMAGADEWDNWDACILRSECASQDEVYLWANRKPTGMNISTRYPSNETADHNIHEFIRTFTDIMISVAESGEWVLS